MKTNEQIINEINLAFGLKNYSELAKELGINSQAVSNWKKRPKIEVSKLKDKFPNINANYILSNGMEGTLLIETSADRLFQAFNALGLDLETIYRETNIVEGYFDNLQNIDKDKIELISQVFPRINKQYIMHGKGIMLNPSHTQDGVNESGAAYKKSLPIAVQILLMEKLNNIDDAILDFKNLMKENNIITK